MSGKELAQLIKEETGKDYAGCYHPPGWIDRVASRIVGRYAPRALPNPDSDFDFHPEVVIR